MVKCWYCEWYHFHRLSNLRNRKILDRRMERWFEQCRRKLRWLHWLLLRLSRDENYIIYNINNVTEYKYNSTKVLRCESWEVHYFNMFGLIPVWQKYFAEPWIICREVCEVTLVQNHPSVKNFDHGPNADFLIVLCYESVDIWFDSVPYFRWAWTDINHDNDIEIALWWWFLVTITSTVLISHFGSTFFFWWTVWWFCWL